MISRPLKNEYSPYYKTYIQLVPEGDLITILEEQLATTLQLLSPVREEQWDYRYAPGKWTLKDVIGHIIDNERVMSYRLLRIARGDNTPLPGYDQDEFMKNDPFQSVTLPDLLEDYTAVRRSTITLLQLLPQQAWERLGSANGTILSARALACIIAGHELHHLAIIKERYLSQ